MATLILDLPESQIYIKNNDDISINNRIYDFLAHALNDYMVNDIRVHDRLDNTWSIDYARITREKYSDDLDVDDQYRYIKALFKIILKCYIEITEEGLLTLRHSHPSNPKTDKEIFKVIYQIFLDSFPDQIKNDPNPLIIDFDSLPEHIPKESKN